MRRAGPLVLGAVLLTALLPLPAGAATVTVNVQNFAFVPNNITIAPGDTVVWHWVSGTHSVVANGTNEVWCSQRNSPSPDCARTFPTAGTFPYRCGVHPSTMPGVVVVGTPATVAITSPAPNATVAGTILVEGTASHPSGIARVEVAVGPGAHLNATGTTAWSFSLPTASLANGPHTIRVRAHPVNGIPGEAFVVVTVANPATVDLQAANLVGSTALLGTSMLTATVANGGNTAASSAALFEYAYQGAWHPIGTTAFTVAGFASTPVARSWSSLTHVGNFTVRVTLDPAGTVAETDEGNNQRLGSAAFYTPLVPGINLLDP